MTHLRRFLSLPWAAALLLLLGGAPAAALAQDDAAQDQDEAAQDTAVAENPAVAVVNGVPITTSEVMAYAETLPPEYRQALDQLFPHLVRRMIDLRLIQSAADDAGLADDEEVKVRMDRILVEVVRNVYLERLIAGAVDEAALQARYDAFVAETPPVEEVHARHILVESEVDARGLIDELDAGADFVTLASERSTGPSSAQGGDLGYFVAEQMVPSFSEAAFALEPGSYTQEPVQTQFGWHVILVEDQRAKPPPSFEETAPQLRQELQGDAVEEHLAGLRATAEIEVMVPPAAEEPAAELAEESAEEPAEESAEESAEEPQEEVQ